MNDLVDILDAIKATSGTLKKQALLRRYEDTPMLKEVLYFIYNPYHKTGISKAKLKIIRGIKSDCKVTLEQALNYFSYHVTGSMSDLNYAAFFINSVPEKEKELAEAIVTQDLQIGVSTTTLNNVYGKNFIPTIGCMLGRHFEELGPTKTKWPCIVTEKLDGIRRLLIKENGVCRCYSRSGHEDTGLVDIMEEARYLPDNRVYDGELLAMGTYKDNIELRQATMSLSNRSGRKFDLCFNVFDMLSVEDFWGETKTETAYERKILLGSLFGDESIAILDPVNYATYIISMGVDHAFKFIKPVPILGYVHSIQEVTPIVESIWARKGEGVMLNTSSGTYTKSRSGQLLKVKKTMEYTLTVVDIEEGSGANENSLGALIVDYDGNRVGVGSGFSQYMRQLIWAHPAKFIGRQIEIDSFGESINLAGTKSLNCPIFKRFVGEEE